MEHTNQKNEPTQAELTDARKNYPGTNADQDNTGISPELVRQSTRIMNNNPRNRK